MIGCGELGDLNLLVTSLKMQMFIWNTVVAGTSVYKDCSNLVLLWSPVQDGHFVARMEGVD